MDERGSISLLGAGVLALMGMAALLLGEMGADAVRRARATAVADAVAMAAAAEPCAAERIASANRSTLVSAVRDGFQTEVVVRRGGATATARAELLPLGWWQSKQVETQGRLDGCFPSDGGSLLRPAIPYTSDRVH